MNLDILTLPQLTIQLQLPTEPIRMPEIGFQRRDTKRLHQHCCS